MKKVLLSVFVVLLVFMCGSVFAAAPVDKPLDLLEKTIYGSAQAGPIIPRLDRLEKEVFGRTMPGSIKDRENALLKFVIYGTDKDLPLTIKVDAVEWTTFDQVFTGPLLPRIERLESRITGKSEGKALAVRIIELLRMTMPNSKIVVKVVDVKKGMLVKVALNKEISSKTASVGERVSYTVGRDFIVDGVLVVPRGTEGEGRVVDVRRAGNFGRSGKLSIDFGTVNTIFEEKIFVGVGKKSVSENEKNKNIAFALGSSIVGLALLGPVGAVAGVFVHGKDIVIPPGTEFYLETVREVSVKGLYVGEKKGGAKQ